MAFRTTVLTWSKGDLMETYWKVFFKRQKETSGWKIDLMTIFLNRRAHAHGGYIGKDTYFAGRPRLPHGLHGIFISRYAHIGKECWIYQNVTIGEVNSKAPTIGNNVLIGAGAVVRQDVPANATVVSGECKMILHDSYRPFDLAVALEKEEAQNRK